MSAAHENNLDLMAPPVVKTIQTAFAGHRSGFRRDLAGIGVPSIRMNSSARYLLGYMAGLA